MSKVINFEPSHSRDTHRRTNATPPSHQRDTGSSYKKSYSSSPPARSYGARDPLGEVTGEVEVETAASRSHRTARFLKGPIPLNSVAVAARLPGKALAVYLAVRHRSDLLGGPMVTLPPALLRDFGIDRDAKARALQALNDAGLVRVEKAVGRTTRVTLLEQSPPGLQ